jgi:hypothetical protein
MRITSMGFFLGPIEKEQTFLTSTKMSPTIPCPMRDRKIIPEVTLNHLLILWTRLGKTFGETRGSKLDNILDLWIFSVFNEKGVSEI